MKSFPARKLCKVDDVDKGMTRHIKILASLLMVATFVFSFQNAHADRNNLNEIKFLERNWLPKLLLILENGPVLLSESTEFEVESPSKNASRKTKKELVYLHEIAKTERTPEAMKRIEYENSGESAHNMFLNEGLIDPDNYKTLLLMEMIDNDHMYFILERKKHYSRPRPSEIDPTLKTAIDNPPHPAYPSGHAGQTYINALVLAEFDPENADVYKQFAIDVAHRREIAGVHYPSDSKAGRKLAVDVLAKLRAIPIFEKKFQDAKLSYIKPDLSGDGVKETK